MRLGFRTGKLVCPSEDPRFSCWSQCDEQWTTLRCARCRLAHYCCSEHQKKHWKSHKEACEVRVSPSPSPSLFWHLRSTAGVDKQWDVWNFTSRALTVRASPACQCRHVVRDTIFTRLFRRILSRSLLMLRYAALPCNSEGVLQRGFISQSFRARELLQIASFICYVYPPDLFLGVAHHLITRREWWMNVEFVRIESFIIFAHFFFQFLRLWSLNSAAAASHCQCSIRLIVRGAAHPSLQWHQFVARVETGEFCDRNFITIKHYLCTRRATYDHFVSTRMCSRISPLPV